MFPPRSAASLKWNSLPNLRRNIGIFPRGFASTELQRAKPIMISSRGINDKLSEYACTSDFRVYVVQYCIGNCRKKKSNRPWGWGGGQQVDGGRGCDKMEGGGGGVNTG